MQKRPFFQFDRMFKLLMLLCTLLLASCGYHLRGDVTMPFKTLYIDASLTPMIEELRRDLQAAHIQLVEKSEQAEVVLNIASESSDKVILSLGSNGRVSEYQLRYRVSIHAYDNEQHDWLPADELSQIRDQPFDDTQIIAMTTEQGQLYQNMRSDIVGQIIRRLSHARMLPNHASDH
jgi:LPS-assembly lipoprotein